MAKAQLCFALFSNLSLPILFRGVFGHIHNNQPMHLHCMARNPLWSWHAVSFSYWIHSLIRFVFLHFRPDMWGRTGCGAATDTRKSYDDCGSGTLECSGGGALPPATLIEFTLNGADGLDFYDVSLVDGYYLPMLISPQGGNGAGNCTVAGCVMNLNLNCPSELEMTSCGAYASTRIACKSTCEAFGDPHYCCSGAYGSPEICRGEKERKKKDEKKKVQ